MIITSNQVLAELQADRGLNHSTLVLMEGAVPSFDAVNSACRSQNRGGYCYVGSAVRDYLTSLGPIALAVSGFAPLCVADGKITVNSERRPFVGALSRESSLTWAILFSKHEETSDFLNSTLAAHAAILLTVGSTGTEDVVLTQPVLPKGSSIVLNGIQISSTHVLG